MSPEGFSQLPSRERIPTMLIKIEEADSGVGWIVVLDTCRVRFTRYFEAEAFVAKLKDRINSPHPLPALDRPVEKEAS